MSLSYVPLTGLARMSFVRTLSGALANSLVTTSWRNRSIRAHAELANVVDPGWTGAALLPRRRARAVVSRMKVFVEPVRA